MRLCQAGSTEAQTLQTYVHALPAAAVRACAAAKAKRGAPPAKASSAALVATLRVRVAAATGARTWEPSVAACTT